MIMMRNLAAGALAGIGGALAMHAFRRCWESLLRDESKHGIFGFDREADANSAQLLATTLLRRTIPESDAETTGLVLHYAYGAAIGGSYALLSCRFPEIRRGFGTAFGNSLWLIADELPIAVLRISNPLHKSVASHVAACGAHLLFGVVVEGATRAIGLSR